MCNRGLQGLVLQSVVRGVIISMFLMFYVYVVLLSPQVFAIRPGLAVVT